MIEIKMIKLIYSHAAGDLSAVEIRPKHYLPAGYTVLAEQMDQKDASAFIRRIRRKYVEGRKRGRYPSQEILALELELFMKLKTYRRKLV